MRVWGAACVCGSRGAKQKKFPESVCNRNAIQMKLCSVMLQIRVSH